MVIPEDSVTAVAKAIPSAVLAILPPKLFTPAPFCINSVPTVRLSPAPVVNAPALVTVMLPPTRLAPVPPMVSPVPVKLNAPDKSRIPVNVVNTVPAFWVKLAAVKVLDANTVPAEVTVTAPRRVPPTAPVKVMLPAPAVNPRVCDPNTVPFSALPNVIAAPVAVPPALVVSTVELANSVTPPAPKLITSPELLIAAARLTGALPVKFSPPLNRKVSAVALPSVTAPEFRKSTFWAKVLPVPVRLTV